MYCEVYLEKRAWYQLFRAVITRLNMFIARRQHQTRNVRCAATTNLSPVENAFVDL